MEDSSDARVQINTLPVVIFEPPATKPLEFLRVWGLGDLFSVWVPTCYQWWVGKEKSEKVYEKNKKKNNNNCQTEFCYWLYGLTAAV